MKPLHSEIWLRSATEPQSSSSPHTKGGKSPVCGHFDCDLMWFRAHTWTPCRPCHSLSPWNSQAGIEGSPQDVLEGSTGISSDRNSVHPSARRPSKTIQRKQQQLQKTNSLICLHSLKTEKKSDFSVLKHKFHFLLKYLFKRSSSCFMKKQ